MSENNGLLTNSMVVMAMIDPILKIITLKSTRVGDSITGLGHSEDLELYRLL
jgi:hypothetical protein